MSEPHVLKNTVTSIGLHTYGHRHVNSKTHSEINVDKENSLSVPSSPILSPRTKIQRLIQDIEGDEGSSDDDDKDNDDDDIITPLRHENEGSDAAPKGPSTDKAEYDLLRAKMMEQRKFFSKEREVQRMEDDLNDIHTNEEQEVTIHAFSLMNDADDMEDDDMNDLSDNASEGLILRKPISSSPVDAKSLESSPMQTKPRFGGLFVMSENEDEGSLREKSSPSHSRLMALLEDDDEEEEEDRGESQEKEKEKNTSSSLVRSPLKTRPEREAGRQAVESIRREVHQQQQLSLFASSAKQINKTSRLRLLKKFGVTQKEREAERTKKENPPSAVSSDERNEPSSTPPTSPMVSNTGTLEYKNNLALKGRKISMKGHRMESTIDLDSDSDSGKQATRLVGANRPYIISKRVKREKDGRVAHKHHRHGQAEKVTLKQLRFMLLEKTRDQMLSGKMERERIFRDKGIKVMTAEEKAKEQVSIAEMLEAERKRAAELSKLEGKDNADDDILDDNDDDDDDSYNGEDNENSDIEMSENEGKEEIENESEDEHNEEESSEEVNGHTNLETMGHDSLYEPLGTVPDRERLREQNQQQLSRSEMEEQEEVEEHKFPRRMARPKRVVIEEDDVDEEEADANDALDSALSNTQADDTGTNAEDLHTGDLISQKDNATGDGLSQFFADTMEFNNKAPLDSQAILDKMRQNGQGSIEIADESSPTDLRPTSSSPSVSSLYRAQQHNARLLYEIDQQGTQISDFSDPVTSLSQHLPNNKEGPISFDSFDDNTQVISKMATSPNGSVYESPAPIAERDKNTANISNEKPDRRSQFLSVQKRRLVPDKSTREFFDAEAEESEDEYQGIGGISDDDDGDDDDRAEDLEDLVDDVTMENVSRADLEALHVENERQQDGELVDKIFRDVMTGGLRKRRRHGADGVGIMDLSDSDDDSAQAQRQQRKRRALERRKAKLLEEDEISKIAANPKAKAFLKELEEEMTEFKVKSVYSYSNDSEEQVMDTQRDSGSQQDGVLSDPFKTKSNAKGDLKRNITVKKDVLQEIREQLSFLDQESLSLDTDDDDNDNDNEEEDVGNSRENNATTDDTQVISDKSRGASVIQLTDNDDEELGEIEDSISKPRSHDNVPKLPKRAVSKLQSFDPNVVASRSSRHNAVDEAEKGTVPRKTLFRGFNMSSSPTRGSSAPRFSSTSKSFSVVRSATEMVGNKDDQERGVTTNDKKKIISSFSRSSTRTLNMRSFQNPVRSAVTYNARKRKEPVHRLQRDKAKAKSHILAAKLSSQSIVTRIANGSFS